MLKMLLSLTSKGDSGRKFVPAVKRSKENSWKLFTSTIGPKSDPSLVWSKVRSLRGLSKEKELHIIKDNSLHTNPTEVANLIGNIFYANSSDTNYDEPFINMNNISDFQELHSNSNPTDQEQKYLNSPISLNELNWVITNSSSLFLGPDEIPYIFIHNLPLSAIHFMLHLFNKIWDSGQIPKLWKHAYVIPIL
ncbi:uncharacterized protein LOC107882509 [Acyrthosiphon pisum]|uniref:Uncharacterized protein n=1 Tax=Acyrthosiphon pisum TaxID=7029 RepID=A0A8R2H6P4_ACYPI|nr:uncharacterized protein LOC107882509 [Acyrthosiphon pisum]|eukprot:XP_016656403.1 PREDICTED: uncharacterized protein LOC107882509 [Acyrthosiphon pisum]